MAFVTGGAAGIGLATARAFAAAGAAVVLADRDPEAAATEAARLITEGRRALGVACDVSDETSVNEAVTQAVRSFGSLDVAFNNAGIHVMSTETADVETADYDRLMAVNLRGVFLTMRAELRQMRQQGAGAVVNCSSQSGLVGIPGLSAYTASKHGVIGLTKAAALEYAPRGIRINAVCPGTTETPLVAGLLEHEPGRLDAVIGDIPLGRMGRPQEIAAAVLWLCSPAASFMVGQIVTPDGGYTAR